MRMRAATNVRFRPIRLHRYFCVCGRVHACVFAGAEVIKAVRTDAEVRHLLGLPQHIRQESGRNEFEAVFQALDRDGSKAIDVEEFVSYFGGKGRRASAERSVTMQAISEAPPSHRRQSTRRGD